jgi:hypothetical protein
MVSESSQMFQIPLLLYTAEICSYNSSLRALISISKVVDQHQFNASKVLLALIPSKQY